MQRGELSLLLSVVGLEPVQQDLWRRSEGEGPLLSGGRGPGLHLSVLRSHPGVRELRDEGVP